MEFNGGGGIVGMPGIPPPAGQPVYLPQNQANLDYVNAQNQASLNANNLYGPGGFGYQTDQYAAAGAAYGRATGGFNGPTYGPQQPGPSYGTYGGTQEPYADRSTLTDAQQQYYDAHEARYGYAPPASFFTSTGPQSWTTMYGGGVTGGGSASAEATTTAPPPGGSGIGPGSSGQVTGGGSNYADRGALTDVQQQYYDAHVARYGYPPPASFFTGSGPLSWATMYGGGASAGAEASGGTAPPPGGSGIGPGSSGQVTGGGSASTDPGYDSLSDAQQQYYQAHIARYGVAPPMSFFTGTGPLSWNTMYGGGGQSAPFQTATGNVGQSPGLGTGYGGFNNQPGDAVRSDLTPVQQGYYDAHVARYGYAPPASFFASSNNGPLSWNVMYGGGAVGGIGAGTNVGDFQQEAINQGTQSMLTLQDQIGAALNPTAPSPTAPSDTLTDADRAAGTVPSGGPGSGIDAINKAAGIDPNTGLQISVPPPTPGEASPFSDPGSPDFSGYRSPEQSYKTFQAANPLVWQQAIPNNDPNISNAIYAAAGNMGVSPAALAALFNQESSFNPKSSQSGNYGVPQMSANQWRDAPFNGTIGGLTWDQYQNQATPAQQIAAYADWMVRSGNLTKSGLSGIGDQSPELQAAILQANNIAPNAPDWRTALVGGNMSMQTGPPQGGNMNDTSIGALEAYYQKQMAPWRH